MSKVILLDRDGVINYDSFEYIKSKEEFIFIPGSIEAIVRLYKAGYRIGVATNQSGVARGLYTEHTLTEIHNRLLTEVRKAGGAIEAIEYCMHLPEHYCLCRKPKPGLLLALAKKLNCTLKSVPFVGDRLSDIEAARAVGASPIIILSKMTDKTHLKSYPTVPVFDSLSAYVTDLLRAN